MTCFEWPELLMMRRERMTFPEENVECCSIDPRPSSMQCQKTCDQPRRLFSCLSISQHGFSAESHFVGRFGENKTHFDPSSGPGPLLRTTCCLSTDVFCTPKTDQRPINGLNQSHLQCAYPYVIKARKSLLTLKRSSTQDQ